MIIQKNINVRDDRLLDGLIPVLDIINQIESGDDDVIDIDFRHIQFVTPLFVLPLMVYMHGSNRQISCTNLSQYLNTIQFPNGLIPDGMRRSEFLARMEGYAHKSYIPIVNFPASVRNDDDKNAVLSTAESIISRQLGLTANIVTGLKYMIGESIDNITEHSLSERGYIFAQAYRGKRYLDVCVADTGITLLGSYLKHADNEIASDLEGEQGYIHEKPAECRKQRIWYLYIQENVDRGIGGTLYHVVRQSDPFKKQGTRQIPFAPGAN
jgi:hypothetical protein